MICGKQVCQYVCICLNIIYDGLRTQCVFQNGIAWNHSKWTSTVDEHGLKMPKVGKGRLLEHLWAYDLQRGIQLVARCSPCSISSSHILPVNKGVASCAQCRDANIPKPQTKGPKLSIWLSLLPSLSQHAHFDGIYALKHYRGRLQLQPGLTQ